MRKILVLILTAVVCFTACKKKEDNVSKLVDITFPSIELNGDKYVSLHVGESYTDPGAVLTDDITGAESNIVAEFSTLDIETPGLYYMQYSAANSNGYITNVGRYIAVTDYDDPVDLSGVYQRVSNGVEVNLSRVARGLYMTDDMGGAGLPDAAYFAVIDDSTIDFGPQLSETIGVEIQGVNSGLEIGPTDTSYTYILDAPGYGTAQRVFVKIQ